MSNPTINNGTETFTFQDGDCETVQVNKRAGLDENPTPVSDSANAFVIDFSGVLRSITISGYLTPAATSRTSVSTTKTIAEQVAWLETLVNGSQTGYTFNSTFYTNLNVFVRKFVSTEKSGDINRVAFNLTMVEGL